MSAPPPTRPIAAGPLPVPARRPALAPPGWLTIPRLFLLAALAAVLVYATSVAILPRRYGHIIVGDGVHYYVYLRSLVHDGTLDFTDEYETFNRVTTDAGKQINTTLRTPTGLAFNMFAAGPALAAAPLYLLAHGLSLAGRAAGLPLPTDGYGLLYEGSFALAGVLASVAAAACAYAALRRLLPVGPALVGVAAVWLGGSLLYYTIASPVYAHAFSALGVAAWFLLWTRLDPRRPRHWLGLGLLGGLMATMRWQEALFALLPMALWTWDNLTGHWRSPGGLGGEAGKRGGGEAGRRGGEWPRRIRVNRYPTQSSATTRAGGFRGRRPQRRGFNRRPHARCPHARRPTRNPGIRTRRGWWRGLWSFGHSSGSRALGRAGG